MTEAALGLLGIMTCRRSGTPPFTESSFYSHLCRVAPLYDLKVIVFFPDQINTASKTVTGMNWRNGEWVSLETALPDIIYNRCFYGSQNDRNEAAAALAALPQALSWSRGVPDKWGVYEILKRSRRAAVLLPETLLYTGRRRLSNMLAEREYGVFLKPSAGTHGKRTLHALKQRKGGLSVRGRDGENAVFYHNFQNQNDGFDWIDRFIGSRRYIMQPYLQLTNQSGQPFDVRVLIQKNGRGLWELTGMAVRLGNRGSLTSNLHGGGTAIPILPFLQEEYGSAGQYIKEQLTEEAAILPPLLEAACGRLGELGLDFGIDGGGRITLLEANSKPGRTVFQRTGDKRAERHALENPLRYARHLLLTNRRVPTMSGGNSSAPGRMISMVPKEDS
ncbi:YheC/YheD family protein [Paenibacillus wynnii]|uniref:YheC/YheD family endospore coat-associated protein n=1 Tax=Paenibacillus wynnii TaxID=268407 RepID=UPI00068FC4FA|nr:YheC/YheD family protein [Paenibacillus wynnii]